MQTKSVEHKSLELKVFSFSVDILSFVKTLEKSRKKSALANKLLDYANDFYANYLTFDEASGKYDKNSFLEESVANAKKCLDILQTIEVEKKHLNEKVDLIIEVAELIRWIGLR